MPSTVIRGVKLLSDESDTLVDLVIEEKTITSILVHNANLDVQIKDANVLEPKGLIASPAFIDCHVHFRDPGFPDKATMASESVSAKEGGVGTVCEMPNTNPPTVSLGDFREKCEKAEEISDCDMRFFYGSTESEHLFGLEQLVKDKELMKRFAGLKLYFDHSTGDQKAEGEVLEEAFRVCAQLGVTIVGHCEDPDMNDQAFAALTSHDIAMHSVSRPPESEAASVEFAIQLAAKYGTKFHIAHLSTLGALDLVRQAKEDGLPITCEVTPHHLFLTTDDYEHLGTLGKMNPPLRSIEHRNALWAGISDGTVDCVSTDHAPHTLEEKQNMDDPLSAPSGVPGVETMIPLLLTVASGHWPHPSTPPPDIESFEYFDLYRLCFKSPNKIFSLKKEDLTEGSPANIVLIDPETKWVLEGRKLHAKCGWTPFEGWKVMGSVVCI